jgi:hypothetical protein
MVCFGQSVNVSRGIESDLPFKITASSWQLSSITQRIEPTFALYDGPWASPAVPEAI